MMLRHACRLSLEGLVSKRRDDGYPAGRSRSWIKSKCSARQEFVIAGYVPSSVSRDLVGSLVLGAYRDGELVHVGRVGTGFGRAVARGSDGRLRRIERKTPPFAEKLDAAARRGVVWVKPELVAEVEFRAWTAEGILRHAAFRGLREDKPAREVVREEAAGRGGADAAAAGAADASRPALLAGRRGHQAGARRLLRRGLAADGAVRRQPAGGAPALPGRHGGAVLLPEACLEGAGEGDPDLRRSRGRQRRAARSRSTACPA